MRKIYIFSLLSNGKLKVKMPKNLDDNEIMARAISGLCRQFARATEKVRAETKKYMDAITIEGLNRILPRKLEELVGREEYSTRNTNHRGMADGADEASARPEILKRNSYN